MKIKVVKISSMEDLDKVLNEIFGEEDEKKEEPVKDNVEEDFKSLDEFLDNLIGAITGKEKPVERRTGKTTRLIDAAVQAYFNHGFFVIANCSNPDEDVVKLYGERFIDLGVNSKGEVEPFINKFLKRIASEHPHCYKRTVKKCIGNFIIISNEDN